MPIDFFVIFGIFIFWSLYSFYFGKSKSLTLILSLYFSGFFYEKIPFLSKMILVKSSSLSITINHLVIFIILTAIFHFLISKHIHSFDSSLTVFESVIFGLAITFFTLYIGYFLISIEPIYNFSNTIDSIFAIKSGIFYLYLIPLIIIFFL